MVGTALAQSRHTVSVVIPALNEADNLPHVLPRIPAWVHEVILVDGHSTDGTAILGRECRSHRSSNLPGCYATLTIERALVSSTGIAPMQYHINLSPTAADDLDYFDAYEQRIIMGAITTYLTNDAHIPTKRRKQLEANQIAPWELKKDKYRIFYDVVDDAVDVLAIGYKDHNDLYIRGRKIAI